MVDEEEGVMVVGSWGRGLSRLIVVVVEVVLVVAFFRGREEPPWAMVVAS